MSRVEVKTRDAALEAYRIETDHGAALVPEHLMGGAANGLRPGARPSHQEAYEWIAAHRKPIAAAVLALRQGRVPKRPYDVITLHSVSSLSKYPDATPVPHAPASDRS